MEVFDTYQRSVMLFEVELEDPKFNDHFEHKKVEWLINQVLEGPKILNPEEHDASKWNLDQDDIVKKIYVSYVRDIKDVIQ